jgi:transcriptional regulator with XRE-family HTH domain
MAEWKRSEQVAFLRVLDAVTGLLEIPAGRETTGRLVAERLLASAFELLGGEDLHHEAEIAGRRLARLTPGDTADEITARTWLRDVLRERAHEINAEVWAGEWGWIDLREHDVWTLLELSPFSRRLRVWSATMRAGATALGSATGVAAHQIGHWAAGRSRPSAADRAALAGALGIHPSWLEIDRDHSADSDLFPVKFFCSA